MTHVDKTDNVPIFMEVHNILVRSQGKYVWLFGEKIKQGYMMTSFMHGQ